MDPDQKDALRQAQEVNKQLDQANARDFTEDEQIHKLLLLGSGESGKSTLFKQMITIYGKGFPDDERKMYDTIIYSNVLSSIKVLVEQQPEHGTGVASDVSEAMQRIDALKGDEPIDEKLGAEIKKIWLDPGIQETYKNRAKYQLTDSAQYFFDRIDEVASQGFLPTHQDVLRSRVRTTGIVENTFVIDDNTFKMFDVGGQRNERKKWIHCFEKVTAVLFVAAISEYDQMLFEDEHTNRMDESLNLFDEICNSRWFRQTAMILFLNKRDLFQEKIANVSLKVCFPDYGGDDGDYDQAIAFLSEEFENKNRHPDKIVYLHVTCATDTSNVSAVFNAVTDIVIRGCLNDAGLV